MKISPNQFAWIFVLLLAGLVGWGIYAAVVFFKNPALDFISVENEVKFGEIIEAQSINEVNGFVVLKNDAVDSAVNEISLRLKSAMPQSNYLYQFKVIDRPEPNAFAIPGGKIYIHSGLILFCNSPEELSSVIAHEIGHVEHRHSIHQLVKQFGVTVLISYITDGGSGMAASISNEMLSNMFSREDESEADEFALNLLSASGIRPALLGEVFQRMKSEHGDMEGPLNLLSTHPSMDERSQKAKAYPVQTGFVEQPFNMNWHYVQSQLQSNDFKPE